MASAFPPLENKAPRATFHKLAQEIRRRNMQIGGNALPFKIERLIRSATSDQRERGPGDAYRLHLLSAQFRGNKAEDANAPGRIAEMLTCLCQELLNVRALHQRERQKGKPASFGDACRERCAVTDTRHWPLHNRVACAMRPRQGRVGGQWPFFLRDAYMLSNGLSYPFENTSDGMERLRKRRGKGGVLAQQPHVVSCPSGSRADGVSPVGIVSCVVACRQNQIVLNLPQFPNRGETGLRIDAVKASYLASQADGFTAIHARNTF